MKIYLNNILLVIKPFWGEQKNTNTMADAIQDLMIQGKLYAGIDGSEKEGIGAHVYGFNSGSIDGNM